MGLRIALAGNPNSGKSTLFNAMTGSNQYVGNWPGVTVEKKEGKYKKDKDIYITDLPGVYSLSPYTLEEVVSRDYLINESPDVIIDIVDASNIERNLYLSTQLSELGIPMVIALNKMDAVAKNNDKIDTNKLSKELGCPVVEITATKSKGIEEMIQVAKKAAANKKAFTHIHSFNEELEGLLDKIIDIVEWVKKSDNSRWYAIKLLEKDSEATKNITITQSERVELENIIEQAEREFDDDGEGIITDARYSFVNRITTRCAKKGRVGLTLSDKIDGIVTNRILALPIFAAMMFCVYYIAIVIVGGPVTDAINEEFIPNVIQAGASDWLKSVGVVEWVVSLISEGIIAGVGAVLGFLPQIATLFLLLSILEDIGYMSRIAFILDRIFRRFGLSGKSFIPILIGTGCSVPGIMATRTIENENDRKMTIIVSSFLPCGAKAAIVTLFAGSVFTGLWWFGPICYFAGIGAVIISGIILKKSAMFSGEPAPFVMELPEYHAPNVKNVSKATWDRTKAFIIKAGTVILVAAIAVWFLKNISVKGEFVDFAEDGTDSLLAGIGKMVAPIFIPLGFGHWIPTVASALGLVAKEMVVGTMGVLSGIGEVSENDPTALTLASQMFTVVSGMSFMMFNQLNIPCFAAVGAIREEMGSFKWVAFTLIYQTLFAYTISFMVYQFGQVLILGQSINGWTIGALVVLLVYIYLLVRPGKKVSNESKRAVTQ